MANPYCVVVTAPASVSSCFKDGVFLQPLHFDKSPTKEEYLYTVQQIRNLCATHISRGNPWEEILEIASSIPESDWFFVKPNGLTRVNIYVNHPIFGNQPFSWEVVNIYPVGENYGNCTSNNY